jgi:hypothetical protein
MVNALIRASSIALVVAAGSATAWSQAAPTQGAPAESLGGPRQEMQADKAMQTPSGKAGKEEPGSHAPTIPATDTMVLVNGSLAVPGAPQDTDTVPAKYSAQNAADDKLITVAYTFKSLPNDQRQAIFQVLKDEQPVANLNAQIGTVLPVTVATRIVPDGLASKVPATEGYHFAVSDNRVLLIAPANRIVVGVFNNTGDAATTGKGDRVR